MNRSEHSLTQPKIILTSAGGSMDAMNKTLRANRNSRPSKRKERRKWNNKNFNDLDLYKHYDLHFKELSPQELQILKEKIRSKFRQEKRRKWLAFGLIVGSILGSILLVNS